MTAKKVAMLIPVGTSLIDNLRKKRIEEAGSFTDLNDNSLIRDEAEKIICSLYDHLFEDLQQRLSTWNPNINMEFPSAEVQSFCFWLAEQPKNSVELSHIILMPTDTPKAKACANKVKEIFEDQILTSEFVKPYTYKGNVILPDPEPFQLRLEDEQGFAEDIAKFLTNLHKKVKCLKGEGVDRIVFNITGGYKGLTPFFSLIGFLEEDIEVIYQHEEAKLVLRVPPLPLSWDYKLFDEYRSFIKRSNPVAQPPAKFRILFERREDQWIKNPFGQLLEDIYDRDRLKRFGYGARLIRRLPSKLREKLEENNIPRWEHIWIGDQIPETVEHSRGHSSRVMEYAASLLEPVFAENPNFLTGEELYCLICCLWLHDVGHTALTFELPDNKVVPIALFPSLVRMLHNLLSYQRILKCEYLPNGERKAVALISKYDRAAIPLKGEGTWDKGKVFGITVGALEKEVPEEGIDFMDGKISKDKVLLLCSLLRVIDALDVQSDRVVDEHYWAERRQRTREEVCYYMNLLEQRLPLLDSCQTELKGCIEQLYEEIKCAYKKWNESLRNCLDWKAADEVREELEGALEGKMAEVVRKILDLNDDLERELLLGTLSLLDRIGFKMLQEAHFRKHSRVKLVYLTYYKDDDNIKYRIQMVFDPDINITDNQKRKIAGEIWKEVEKVKDILKKNGLYFEGVFEDEKQLQGGNG